MTIPEYKKLVIGFYPEFHNIDVRAIDDIIEKVAHCLFIDRDLDSVLAVETRKQLIMLRDYYKISFEENV